MSMLQNPNTNAGHLIGMNPLYIGMRVRLTVKLSAKYGIVQDAAGEVVCMRFHPREFETPDAEWRNNEAHKDHKLGYYRCNTNAALRLRQV